MNFRLHVSFAIGGVHGDITCLLEIPVPPTPRSRLDKG
ncbi:MAG: hypothetical protein ACI9X4_001136, partial [Glaciecola sp.]